MTSEHSDMPAREQVVHTMVEHCEEALRLRRFFTRLGSEVLSLKADMVDFQLELNF